MQYTTTPKRVSNIWLGVFLVTAGMLTAANRLNAGVPDWAVSWPAAVLGAGLLLAVYHRFKPGIWVIPVLWGGWLLAQLTIPSADLNKYTTPMAFIMVGVLVILIRQRPRPVPKPVYQYHGEGYVDFTCFGGNTKREVANQNFTGADAVCVLGNAVIDLSKATLQQGAHIDVTVFMASAKILIPANWSVYDDVTTFFGDIKYRNTAKNVIVTDEGKMVTIDGTAFLGGIEIIGCQA
jgi:predicted membrane protein